MSSRQIPVQLEVQARYVLLSALAEGRRILDVGCRDGRGLALLAEAEAAEITATSDVPDRVGAQLSAAGIEGVEVLLETEGPLPFGDAAFDLVICHDLSERAAPALLAELRRVLDRGGYLAVATVNPPGRMLGELWGRRESSRVAYEELYELLAPKFGLMTAFGQSPLVASLFYDLASEEEDPGLVFDRSLMDDDEQPGWYVLLFGPKKVGRDELAIVQLPFEELRAGTAPIADGSTPSLAEAELEAVRARVVALEQELAAARAGGDSEALAQLAAEHDQLGAERDQLALERDQLAAERDQLSLDLAAAQARGLDATTVDVDIAVLQAQHQDELTRVRLAEESSRQELEARLAEAGSRLADAEGRSEALAARMTELEVSAQAAEQRLQELRLLEQQAEVQQQELTLLRRAHEESAGRDELEAELASERNERASLESQLARARHDGSSMESQIRDLLEESAQLRRALDDAQASLSAASLPREERFGDEPALASSAADSMPPADGATVSGDAVPQALDDEGLASVTYEPAAPALEMALDAAGAAPGLGTDDAAPEPMVELALDAPEVSPEVGTDGAAPEPMVEIALDGTEASPELAAPTAAPIEPVYEASAPALVDDGTPASVDLAGAGMAFDEGVTVEAYPEAMGTIVSAPSELEADGAGSGEPAPESSLDALVAEAAGLAAEPSTAPSAPTRADEPMFGELEIGTDAPAQKPRGPVTLDDLEDLLASSIPGRRR